MKSRFIIVVEIVFAALWTYVVFKLGSQFYRISDAGWETVAGAFLWPGLMFGAMIMAVGLHRFIGGDAASGGQFQGKHAQINQRVLINTGEQLILAMAIWPAAALRIGEAGMQVLPALGISFCIARVLFWAGYHIRHEFRAFGFAATFYPTIVFGIWAVFSR